MRIGIDARFLTHPQRGGFKTYTTNLVRALAEVDAENEYVLYVDNSTEFEASVDAAFVQKPNFQVRVARGTIPMMGMLVREQMSLPILAMADKLDVLHSPSLTAPMIAPCPQVVTIHDMIWRFPERFPERFPDGTATPQSAKRKLLDWYYRAIPQRVAARAVAIITVSRAAKQDILNDLRVPTDRVFVTYEAANASYRRVIDPAVMAWMRSKHELGSKFVLALGSADSRKNLPGLLKAFAELPDALRRSHTLGIVWAHSHLSDSINDLARTLGILDRVRFLHRVSDADLAALYSAATLFAFPSLYEGFGLPLLEAMACGAPVIAADNSSIPEVAGDAALFFPAEDVHAMSAVIAKVLADDALQAQLAAKGVERAATFSWARCARETLVAYHAALHHSSRKHTQISAR